MRTDELHHPDGAHRTTPASTRGRVLERHERKLRAHLEFHAARERETQTVIEESS